MCVSNTLLRPWCRAGYRPCVCVEHPSKTLVPCRLPETLCPNLCVLFDDTEDEEAPHAATGLLINRVRKEPDLVYVVRSRLGARGKGFNEFHKRLVYQQSIVGTLHPPHCFVRNRDRTSTPLTFRTARTTTPVLSLFHERTGPETHTSWPRLSTGQWLRTPLTTSRSSLPPVFTFSGSRRGNRDLRSLRYRPRAGTRGDRLHNFDR